MKEYSGKRLIVRYSSQDRNISPNQYPEGTLLLDLVVKDIAIQYKGIWRSVFVLNTRSLGDPDLIEKFKSGAINNLNLQCPHVIIEKNKCFVCGRTMIPF